MCGIIGILGKDNVADRLIDGLKRLEYRGYDSAGIATLNGGGMIERRRAEGKLANLEQKIKSVPLDGHAGIGHTRWATHGGPTEDNAHPHATDKVAVVHNGIIENYAALKKELENGQVRFETETDTEVIAHLCTHYMKQGLSPEEAAQATFDRLEGAYAVVLIFAGHDDLMIGCRHGTPLAVGYGEGEMFMASDSYALAPLTKKICFLEDGDRAYISRKEARITANDNRPVERDIRVTAQSGALSGKGPFKHFMLKEIHEQPAVIGETLNSYIHPSTGHISLPDDIMAALTKATRITLIGCGGSHYASMLGKYWIESLAGVPCEVDIASEFRYREAPLPEGGLCIFTSQSGETLDTLEALRYCKSQGQTILSIVNTIESTIERESDYVLRTLAGPEIAVASTKATITQYTTFACMALALARQTGKISETQEQEMADALRHIPTSAANVLKHDEAIREIARDVVQASYVLYLGRGSFYPIALEGALKLKEICYIYAEGYAAGEMKHGPIALIDDSVPVVMLGAGRDPLFDKTASNVRETAARGGKILAISDAKGIDKTSDLTSWQVEIDEAHPFVAPILYTIPVQLLAYHVAVLKGTDVDQPRNLAKSVTVE